MASPQIGVVLRHIRAVAGAGGGEVPDALLLERFLTLREEEAFAALVRRHGPMVFSVCRGVLGHWHDAEDAFQATFLTLAQKASTIRRGQALGSWLHEVAYHLAVKAQARAAHRRAQECLPPAAASTDPVLRMTVQELQLVLHEELARLPEKYRAPLVLCYLEGRTQEEAARQLGWTRRRVKGRLQRGRERLHARLARRGLTLPVGVLATALALPAATAAVPAALAGAAARAAVSGASAAPGVAALAGESTRTLLTGKVKVAALLVLLAGVAAGSALWHRPADARPPAAPAAPAGEEVKKAPAEGALEEGSDRVTVRGRVLGPDGKPFRGAEVTVWWTSHRGWVAWHHPGMYSVRPHRAATSGADGSFRFTLKRADIRDTIMNTDARPWRRAWVVAAARGYGPAWARVKDFAKGKALRLVRDDVPIKGRVRTLEGKPVVGAGVRLALLQLPGGSNFLEQDSWDGLPANVTTGKDGSFVLTGVGRDRVAVLLLSGPGIETRVLSVSTKDAKSATAEVLAGPTRVIEGTVTARDTGKPLAGAWVYGNEWHYCNAHMVRALRAVTDSKGRYRLVGYPKSGSYHLTVYPAEGQPYLAATRNVADGEGAGPLKADFALRRGVPVRFRLVDRETGKPVRGQVQYEVCSDNPYRSEADIRRGVIPSREFMRIRGTDHEGYISFVAYPGPGVIFAQPGWGSPPYLLARLDPADAARGHYPGPKGDPCNGFVDISKGYRRIDPDPARDKLLTFDVFFTRGRDLKGTLLGPGGKPVRGATAYGVTFDASAVRTDFIGLAQQVLPTESFTALGCYPKERRTVSFVHKGRKLIGHVVVDGTEKGPLGVRLRPWGALIGRLVDPGGKPLAGVRVRLHYPSLPRPGMLPLDGEPVTDKDGKFHVERLLPGLAHELTLARGPKEVLTPSTALNGLSAGEGEVKDLGKVRVKLIPVK
jgi:RNA polymerase sigma factor (sigma-70 family)